MRLETIVIINTRRLRRAIECNIYIYIVDDHNTNNNDYFISIKPRKLNERTFPAGPLVRAVV